MRGAWDAAASELGLGLAGAGGGHCRASVGLVCVTSINQSTDKLVPAVQQEGWRPESQPRENAASSRAVSRGRTGSAATFL